uniref:Odorant receptor n=1 Tax=Cacopsylla melanoneura TaxID=428564 RepID=A0A8D8PTF7_9HEMI
MSSELFHVQGKVFIERHQQLNYFMFKYHQLMNSLNLLTTLPYLTGCILSCYQLAYLKHLPWLNCMKIIVEFFFLSGSMWHIITQSEELNHCNEIVEQAVYDSHWNNATPQMRKTVCLILQNAQAPKYLRFLNGMVLLRNEFLLQWYRTVFSFLNFMKLNGYL